MWIHKEKTFWHPALNLHGSTTVSKNIDCSFHHGTLKEDKAGFLLPVLDTEVWSN